MSRHGTKAGLPIIAFPSASAWEEWLAAQPRTSKGIWLKMAKRQSGITSVSRREAIDGALCHGWIDGQLQPFNDRYWLIRFTPRSVKSKWSKINQNRAQELIDESRMSDSGLNEVDRAKADGRWDAAYTSQSTAEVPEDLRIALGKNRAASLFFAKLDSANRYAILYRLHDAKKPETRASRIKKFIEMLERQETLHPLRAKKLAR